MKPQPVSPVPRLSLTPEEAAASLGVSLSTFRRHIAPDLRVVRCGSARLYPVRELDKWVERSAGLAGESAAA